MTTDHAPGGILMRLRRDKRGNVLAISAGALIPLIGFSGSAVDMGRLYLVKVRLQQACDAGVLAGRKVMTDTSMSSSLDSNAKTQAQAFFANNFRAGYLRTSKVAFTPVKAASGSDTSVANAVTGTATATVPLAVMGMLGAKPQRIDVTCQAVFDLADTDVMFVLDTTGSMSCTPSDPTTCGNTPITSYTRKDGTTGWYNPEKSGSKLAALRDAVVLFDDTMRANADSTTHFRYGFVTYSSAVNVGYSIPSTYLSNGTGTYQSRQLSPDIPNVPQALAGDYANTTSTTSFSFTGVAKSLCVDQRSPATGFAKTGKFAGTSNGWSDNGYYQARTYYGTSWTSANGGTCAGTTRSLRAMWRYGPYALSVNQWATGATTINPTRFDGNSSKWRGCVEEPVTTTASSFDVTALPPDLDPDNKPTTAAGKWRPHWPDVVWNRETFGTQDVKDESLKDIVLSRDAPNGYALYNRNYGSGAYYDDNGSAACGMPAARLKEWTSQQVKNYVNDPDFKPFGGTYHDVGMIWGARMISPDGVFGGDTKAWAGRTAPGRNIVFMTDGTLSPSQFSYGQYGVEIYDNRTGGQNDTDQDYDNHTARFRAVCDAAKRKGITIYVVALGTNMTDDLTYCASPGQTFQASSKEALTSAFKSIAQRVAMLRLTQ